MTLTPIERPLSVETPFLDEMHKKPFLRWCRAMGFSEVRTISRSDYHSMRKSRTAIDGSLLVLPEWSRIRDLPDILLDTVCRSDTDALGLRALMRIRQAIDEWKNIFLALLRSSAPPSKSLKQWLRALIRLQDRLDARLHTHSEYQKNTLAHDVLDATRGQLSLLRERLDDLDECMIVSMSDASLAETILREFYAVATVRTRSMLRTHMRTFSRGEYDESIADAVTLGMQQTIRVDRWSLRVRPVVLARALSSVRSRLRQKHLDTHAIDFFLRRLVVEVAAYPWTDDVSVWVPEILETKHMGCVGKSLLVHTFLALEDIPHTLLDMVGHSAIRVDLGGTTRYLDPTNFVAPIILANSDPAAFGYEALDIPGFEKHQTYARPMRSDTGIVFQMLSNIASAYAQEKQWFDAHALAEHALIMEPRSAGIHFLQAKIEIALGNDDAAHTRFETTLSLHPAHTDAHRGLGAWYYARGRFREARRYFSTGLRTDDSSPSLWYDYGLACLQLSDLREARAAFARTLDLDEYHERARTLWEHLRDSSSAD